MNQKKDDDIEKVRTGTWKDEHYGLIMRIHTLCERIEKLEYVIIILFILVVALILINTFAMLLFKGVIQKLIGALI